ncbi:MAG TPA: Asp-tRNA(Asn)/Glu-tRNA(Gln) amidotransferase subunit GatA [Candidatus Saccharimonadales bacterium]|nr:Asp-tRNA(Asn)/Glu-tRNA(Gln) amidotransferase subunit GatA [Candidatus Saccharimonadales bacterium]
MSAPTAWTIPEVRAALDTRKISTRELVKDFYGRIEQRNPELNIFLALSPERAYAQADKIDAAIAAGDSLPVLAGVPVAIKDVISTRGIPTTCGSRILAGYTPAYDATAVTLLERAGAVVLGKTNCDEFAMGSSNENSAYGPVRNPVAPDHVPGGSSGGSAAAVAANLAVASLGTDTGGSIRQPGSFCGVPALNPSYGRVSRFGLIAYASSLDRIGPFAHTVNDTATVMSVIAGRDPRDATSASIPVPDYAAGLGRPLHGLRIGIPDDYFGEGIDPDVRKQVEAGIALLEKLGCRRVSIRMPNTEYAVAAYYIIATAEASSNLARYDGVRYGPRVSGSTLTEMYQKTRGRGFGAEVKRRIVLGTYVLSAGYYDAYYLKGQKVRALIAGDFREAFEKVDAIVTPTSPVPAFRIGERTANPLQMYLADIYTVTGSLAGVPGISVPSGKTPSGLPVGLQIYGPAFGEDRVLHMAHAFEQAGGSTL